MKYFLILSCLLKILFGLKLVANEKTVELVVYSGRENPSFTLSGQKLEEFNQIINKNNLEKKVVKRELGYRGLIIYDNEGNLENIIQGVPEAEDFILDEFENEIPRTVCNHIKEKIVETKKNQSPWAGYQSDILKNATDEDYASGVVCNYPPIRGPQTRPEYNPKIDGCGCFESMATKNNCYNYATDIVTNTFAQPGKAKGKKFRDFTCKEMIAGARADGLKYLGRFFPSMKIHSTNLNLLALVIWPETDFHWYRLDINKFWSHKPGKTPVRNVDGSGNPITNPHPSRQDSKPYTIFCGYFTIERGQVTIK